MRRRQLRTLAGAAYGGLALVDTALAAGPPGWHRARVVTKQELSDYLYPHGEDRDSNVLEVLIGRLRRKLDPEGTLAPIETVRGRGYRFTLG